MAGNYGIDSASTLRARSQLPPADADALLIWPRGGNSGDTLILDACQHYLRDRGIHVWVSDGSIEDAVVKRDSEYLGDLFATYRGMVMFPGGGNVGIYPSNGFIRAGVIAGLRPHHRCLVFPQSAVAPEKVLRSPQVTVWCRDAVSQAILAAAGIRTALVPDASLYLGNRFQQSPEGTGTFYVRRARGGDTETIEHGIGADLPSADLTHSTPLAEITATLAPYETIVSDRLHGGLIAMMMGKKTVLLPVGYHKMKSFHETWLSDLDSVGYAESSGGLQRVIARLRSSHHDFSALFCRHADPALQRFLLDA